MIVNLFGGPGIGKSTTAAGLFYKLKLNYFEAELVTEYAKDATWEQRYKTLENQFYVTAKQHHRIWRILEYWKNKNVNGIIVTDSPFILGIQYLKESESSEEFKKFILKEFNKFNNLNILLKRKKKYNPIGRNQTEDEAKQIDINIKNFLQNNNIDYIEIEGDENAVNKIFEIIKNNYKNY